MLLLPFPASYSFFFPSPSPPPYYSPFPSLSPLSIPSPLRLSVLSSIHSFDPIHSFSLTSHSLIRPRCPPPPLAPPPSPSPLLSSLSSPPTPYLWYIKYINNSKKKAFCSLVHKSLFFCLLFLFFFLPFPFLPFPSLLFSSLPSPPPGAGLIPWYRDGAHIACRPLGCCRSGHCLLCRAQAGLWDRVWKLPRVQALLFASVYPLSLPSMTI